MNELIERVQEALDNNWAVEAEDIQILVDASRELQAELDMQENLAKRLVKGFETLRKSRMFFE